MRYIIISVLSTQVLPFFINFHTPPVAKAPDKSKTTPPKTCARMGLPVLTFTSAPTIGFPANRPNAPTPKLVPILVPNSLRSFVMNVIVIGPSTRIAPEKNPYRSENATPPPTVSTTIQADDTREEQRGAEQIEGAQTHGKPAEQQADDGAAGVHDGDQVEGQGLAGAQLAHREQLHLVERHVHAHQAQQPAVIFLDWSQYGAPGWTEICPRVDVINLIGGWSGSKVIELLEL